MGSQLFKFGLSKDKPLSEQERATLENDLAKLEMSDATFNEIRSLIYDLCGIYFSDRKKNLLEAKIAKRLVSNKISSYEEYISFLKSYNGRTELKDLFDAITINETFFFRSKQQLDAFENIIVPEIIAKKNGSTKNVFRIWSAAASTGEEAYTLAIIILERIKNKYPDVQFQILASDINNAVLELARKGIYKEYAVRNIPADILQNYFTKSDKTFIISDKVKKMVKFVNINLYDPDQMKSISNCDVIFCSNVLIYFDVPSKQKVISFLYNSLNSGGYLFLGDSESLHGVSKEFKLIHLPKAMAYAKE